MALVVPECEGQALSPHGATGAHRFRGRGLAAGLREEIDIGPAAAGGVCLPLGTIESHRELRSEDQHRHAIQIGGQLDSHEYSPTVFPAQGGGCSRTRTFGDATTAAGVGAGGLRQGR
jgi:hypothetical protein